VLQLKKDKLDLYRQTKSREWEIKPITKVVPNKKKAKSKKFCRQKVAE
jgi:uncharacterized protein (UPF0335 family)